MTNVTDIFIIIASSILSIFFITFLVILISTWLSFRNIIKRSTAILENTEKASSEVYSAIKYANQSSASLLKKLVKYVTKLNTKK